MQHITAVIMDKRGQPLSIGRNSYTKTHPLQAKAAAKVGQPERIYIHAELDAIIRCKDMDRAYKIVVSRYNKQGQPVNAKPCLSCQYILSQTKLKVFHT